MPKFLQRLQYVARLQKIVQYHPQAESAFAREQGYVVATIEPMFVEHGASLAAGPEALTLLERFCDSWEAPPHSLVEEAQALLARVTPPEGSVHPNGTPRVPPKITTAVFRILETAARATVRDSDHEGKE